MYTHKFTSERTAQYMADLLNVVYTDEISTSTGDIVRTTVSPSLFHYLKMSERISDYS